MDTHTDTLNPFTRRRLLWCCLWSALVVLFIITVELMIRAGRFEYLWHYYTAG